MQEWRIICTSVLLCCMKEICFSQKSIFSSVKPMEDVFPKGLFNNKRKFQLGRSTNERRISKDDDINEILKRDYMEKNVYWVASCDQFLLDDNDAVIITSRHNPESYECSQSFESNNKEMIAKIMCMSIALRINCNYESLTISTNSTTLQFCGNQPDRLLPITGKYLKILYKRKLFGIFGGFSCIVSAEAPKQNERIKEEPAPKDYSGCGTCGLRVEEATGKTRSKRFAGRNVSAFDPTLRIVGGVKANRGEYPWIVFLSIKERNVNEYYCGGTLVSRSAVITAAHCLEVSNLESVSIGFGLNNRKIKSFGSEIRHSTDFVIHRQYDSDDLFNDIAIVRFSPVEFNDYIKPICLPSTTLGSLTDLTASAAGWGYTDYKAVDIEETLQHVDLKIWSESLCKSRWNTFAAVKIRNTQICAYGNGKDSCKGDSGGPLILQLQSRWILVGVTSYGYKCAHPDLPGVYTRVTSFLDWIKDQISIDSTTC